MLRKSIPLCVITLCVILLGTSQRVVDGADKDDKADKAQIQRLQNQLKEANNDLQKAQIIINNLKQDVLQAQAKIKSLQDNLQKERKDDVKDNAVAKDLDALRRAGFAHVIVFKLKGDAPGTAVKSFIDDAQTTLPKVKGVRGIWVGERDATGASGSKEFNVAITVLLDDPKGLKAFEDDATHKQFWKKHEKNWEAPQSFNFLPRR